ncbi:MAG: type IV toxin-antitoxin system AbiEi family antitoxin domain-containing protein [Methanobacteriota archaeon]
MRNTLLEKLANKKTFTIDDAQKISSVNKAVLKVILSRLQKQGYIERIEKGKYMIIPLGAKKGTYTLDEFVLGSILINPCIIAYWSALHYHGLTEQIPRTVFLQTTARKKKQEITVFGITYKIIRIKKEKIFGTENAWFEDKKITVTDKEKTIIDCLDKPHYSGGIIEIAKALTTKDYDTKKLSIYAQQLTNTGVIRRLGYLCDTLHIPITLPTISTRNYLMLDPTQPKTTITNAKWRLIINEDIEVLE